MQQFRIFNIFAILVSFCRLLVEVFWCNCHAFSTFCVLGSHWQSLGSTWLVYLDAVVPHFRPLRCLGVVLAPLRGCLSPPSVHLVEVFCCNGHAFSTFALLGATLAVLGAIFLLSGVRLVGAFRCNCFPCSPCAPSWCRSGVSWGSLSPPWDHLVEGGRDRPGGPNAPEQDRLATSSGSF